MGGVVRMQPVVQETIQTRVVDEIQPVIHREAAIAQVERVEEHITERVCAPTSHTNSVVYEASQSNLAQASPVGLGQSNSAQGRFL